ncbi:MAG: hypothetical protein ACJ8AT_05115 [Hyalangium sp.]|uniref:hypothetical protein n=1 Tax=Hyalangium sp. TaxID=2028555 RepID=UPI00389A82BA
MTAAQAPAQTAASQGSTAQAPAQDAKPGTTSQATGQEPTDPGWPRTIEKGGNRLVYYQPQVDSWKNNTDLTALVAVEVFPSGEQKPIVGMVEAKGKTAVDLDTRTVRIDSINVTLMRFSESDAKRKATGEKLTRELFPKGPVEYSLDRLIADVARTEERAKSVTLKNAPPKIFVSETPARLVVFDGEPVFNPIEKTGLEFAVNTNWPVFRDPATKKYYLLDEKTWLEADDVKGSWRAAASLPKGFSSLPNSDQWKDVRAALPIKPRNEQAVAKIFVSTEPAEIILTKGKPKLVPISGTALKYVENTDSQLFWDDGDKNYYFLVAGRWFRAGSLQGPWTYTTPKLPADFARIPPDSPKGSVLAAVPGTTQAREAVLEAEIPQLATVNRAETQVKVSYVGEPQFKPVEGTNLAYAVNTEFDVVKAGNTYYVCHQGVWFSGPSPTGPFAVTDKVPAEIYKIPPSSPVYNVTYVNVYNSDDDAVLFGFTAGYIGGFITAGILTWGTGYWYRPWIGPYHGAPVYFGRPYTYGAGVHFNARTGAYYRGGAAYGPYGGVGASARYNPATGRYSRGVAAYGPYQRGSAARAYNPRTGVASASYQRANPYGNWGRSVATGPGGRWAETGHASGARGSAAGVRTSSGRSAVTYSGARGQGTVARGADNNVYAGKDGNVYRRTDSGWQNYDNGNWKNAERGTPEQRQAAGERAANATPEQRDAARERASSRDLNSEAQARADGAQRQQSSQAARSAEARSPSGASRPSGGARRGGGGGRRGR